MSELAVRISYVITLQWPVGNGVRSGTCTGTWDVRPGPSRAALAAQIEKVARRDIGVPEDVNPVILFLSIDRDEL